MPIQIIGNPEPLHVGRLLPDAFGSDRPKSDNYGLHCLVRCSAGIGHSAHQGVYFIASRDHREIAGHSLVTE